MYKLEQVRACKVKRRTYEKDIGMEGSGENRDLERWRRHILGPSAYMGLMKLAPKDVWKVGQRDV